MSGLRTGLRRLVHAWPLIPFAILVGAPILALSLQQDLGADEGDPGETGPRTEAPAALAPADGTRLMGHVEWLCSVERMGRQEAVHRKATATWVAARFQEAGLETAPGLAEHVLAQEAPTAGEGEDPSTWHDALKDERTAFNVVGWLPGRSATRDPEAPGDYVIVSAHHDHLGTGKTPALADGTPGPVAVFNGADDNASGVAAMLEMARLLRAVSPKDKPAFPRSILFVAFDLEEAQLVGSRRFAQRCPLPLASCKAFVTMDMLGRSLADLAPGSLFLMGLEQSPDLGALCEGLGDPVGGRVLPMGIDFQPGYSDYVPFADRKIPYVFLTSGACTDYHTPHDVPARLEAAHLRARTDFAAKLLRALAEDTKDYAWSEAPQYPAQEIPRLAEALGDVEKNLANKPGIPPMAANMLKGFRKTVEQVLEDGEVTAEERTKLRTTAIFLFNAARQMQAPR